MVSLSVNVNKVATLRNSRGGRVPSVLEAVDVCVTAGAAGITVHPRADRRHITPEDVDDIARRLATGSGVTGRRVEYNIEGDPRPDWVELVERVRPDQCTLVPVAPGEVTSQAGWRAGPDRDRLLELIERLKARGIRVSLFVDAADAPIEWAARVGADRVELYTEPFARAFERGKDEANRSLADYSRCTELAHSLGLGVNAGHDLDLENLQLFRSLPYLEEVSIGHAIMSRAVFVGLSVVVQEYLKVLSGQTVV